MARAHPGSAGALRPWLASVSYYDSGVMWESITWPEARYWRCWHPRHPHLDADAVGEAMSERDRATSGGVELTDAKLDELADEAERGYEPEQLRARSRRGRPPLGSSAASVFHVRLEPALREALERAADAEQTTASELVRRALRRYLDQPPSGPREAC